MRAIQILWEEHRTLRGVLDALELALECQRVDDRLDAEIAVEALEWFEHNADGLHQDREELGLFPRLEARAPARAQEVLSGLTRWHACERERLDAMRAEIEGAAYGDPFCRDCFTAAARRYIELQRQHTNHEDAELLPLARAVLTPDDDEIILAEYARLEERHLRSGQRTPCEAAARIIARAAELALEAQPSLMPARREGGVRGSAVPSPPHTPRRSR